MGADVPLALVTGANGFLGLNIVEQLLEARWDVVGLILPGSEREYLERFSSVEVREGNILDRVALDAAMPQDADAVFHTAADLSLWSRHDKRQYRVNVEGTRNVCAAALGKRARRFIQTSTWNTFGVERDRIDESTVQSGEHSSINYVRTKTLAEKEVRQAIGEGLHAIILNPGHLIGRYDLRNWGRMIRMVATDSLPGVPKARGSFCHAEAVALAHISAVKKGRRGENYILPGVRATFAEVLGAIAQELGKPAPKRTLSPSVMKSVARIKTLRAYLTGKQPDLTPAGVDLLVNDPEIVTEKAAVELGYRITPLADMIKDACDWMKVENLLSAHA